MLAIHVHEKKSSYILWHNTKADGWIRNWNGRRRKYLEYKESHQTINMVNISSHISFGMAVLKIYQHSRMYNLCTFNVRRCVSTMDKPTEQKHFATSEQRKMDLLLVLRSLAAEACN